MVRVRRVSDTSILTDQSEKWDAIATESPLAETSWLQPWWQQYGDEREAYLLIAEDDEGSLVGALPLYRVALPTGERRLHHFADGNTCTDFVSVIARHGDRKDIAVAFANYLIREHGSSEDGWQHLQIDGVSEGDEAMTALAQTLEAAGALTTTKSKLNTWRLACKPTWAEFLATCSKRQRSRFRKQLCRIESKELDIWTPHTINETYQAIEKLIELHQARQTGLGQQGSYHDPSFRQFVHDAAGKFFANGRLLLPCVKHDNEIISVSIFVEGRDRVLYCYSCGSSPDHMTLEPGHAVNAYVAQQACESGLAGIDFMRGDEPYKERLGAHPTRVLEINAAAPTLVPLLQHMAWRTSFQMTEFVRRSVGRPATDIVELKSS